MRHLVAGRKLGRRTEHRWALFRNQVTSLLEKERIITTLPKAKEIRPLAEKMITLGKRGTLAARRQALGFIKKESVVAKLFNQLASRFSDRPGGYTRIVRLRPRWGDGAELALIELVDAAAPEKKKKKKAE